MKNAQCKNCLNKFYEKEIYTIQQCQYRKEPNYKWSLNFFKKLGIDEWDSFCEKCLNEFLKISKDEWNESKNTKT